MIRRIVGPSVALAYALAVAGCGGGGGGSRGATQAAATATPVASAPPASPPAATSSVSVTLPGGVGGVPSSAPPAASPSPAPVTPAPVTPAPPASVTPAPTPPAPTPPAPTPPAPTPPAPTPPAPTPPAPTPPAPTPPAPTPPAPAPAGGAGSGLTKLYINDEGGTIYEYDSSDWSSEVVVARGTGAFSISSGPAANTLYLQMGSYFSAGPLKALDLTTRLVRHIGGDVPGNALGEARNGFLFAGSGVETYRVDPNTGQSTYLGDGDDPYAGDFAVDPTTNVLYGSVTGRRGVTLVTVDRATGRQTVIGPLGLARDIWGMGFSLNGDLFAAGPSGSGGGTIYAVSKATGAAQAARSLSYEPFDMATQPYVRPEHEEWPPAPGPTGSGVAIVDSTSTLLDCEAAFAVGEQRWSVGPVDLTGAARATLELTHARDAGGRVVVSADGVVWTVAATLPAGPSGGLATVAVDLTPWAGRPLRVGLERDGAAAWTIARLRVIATR